MKTDEKIGFGSPPKSSRFKKGQSGNRAGRPKGSRNYALPHDAVLGQMVTVQIEGEARQMTAEEAFLLKLTQRGLSGDNSANRYALDILQKAKTLREAAEPKTPSVMPVRFIHNGVDCVLEDLGLAVLKFATDKSRSRWELNPWIVEKALERLDVDWIGLSEEEQQVIWEATRTPRKVKWPDWWTYRST